MHAKMEGPSEQALKRQQKADETRAHHFQIVAEQMKNIFLSRAGGPLVAKLAVAGPGNLKAVLTKHLPQPVAKTATDTATNQSGKAGLWELAQDCLRRGTGRRRRGWDSSPGI